MSKEKKLDRGDFIIEVVRREIPCSISDLSEFAAEHFQNLKSMEENIQDFIAWKEVE